MGRRPRRPRREHELGRNEFVIDSRQRSQLRALEGDGRDGRSRKLQLQLPDLSGCDSGRDGVAGTTNSDTKQGDSNYGDWVRVAAAEGNITSWPSLNGAPGYAPVGGTSIAAPVVAALAGLLFSANPSLTGTQVEQALESSAVPLSFVQYGRVDALAALNYVGFADPQPPAAPSNASPPQVLLETNGVYNTTLMTGSPHVGQVLLRGQGNWTGSAPLSLTNVEWQRCEAAGSTCTTVATAASYTVQSADTGYALRIRITVGNGFGTSTAVSNLTGAVGGGTSTAPPLNLSPPTISGTAQGGPGARRGDRLLVRPPNGIFVRVATL